MEKKLELNTQSFSRQLHSEKAKHSETREKLKFLQEKIEELENRLKVFVSDISISRKHCIFSELGSD